MLKERFVVTDTPKHPALQIHSAQPFNAGPPPELLCEYAVTPVDRFYVRNHGSAPTIDTTNYRLVVDGQVERPLELSLTALREQYPSVAVTATLQCAGNRRSELMEVRPIPGELRWEADAIGNAEWRGVPLAAVLEAAGVDTAARYVAFTGLDTVERQEQTFGFGGSIPLAKACTPEVLLAYEMNGAALPAIHGGPLRVVTPGFIGARSVKWLHAITVQSAPSANYFQQHAYKLFGPDVTADNVDWTGGTMLEQTALNAVICEPQPDAALRAGRVTVRGYAIGDGGAAVARVEISADGGAAWHAAQLVGAARPWAWCLWQAELELPAGRHTLVARATDCVGNTQPADVAPLWNLKGYMNNAWHQIAVDVR